jgi:hypothetical protein
MLIRSTTSLLPPRKGKKWRFFQEYLHVKCFRSSVRGEFIPSVDLYFLTGFSLE